MDWVFTRTRLREGYAIEDVDTFLARVRDTLDGTAPAPLTPAQVREQRFTTVRLREGYDEDEVDAALDEIEARLAARAGGGWGATAGPEPTDAPGPVDRFAEARAEAEVKAITLRPPQERFESVRRGYGRDEVDVLVARVDEALRGRVRLSPEEVLADRFEVARRGYDRTEVDAWRARVADLLVRRRPDDTTK
ncbi:DivIVA domain-containing protein [Embleya sp. AB8]|uniref:DivIVA domain-containing protein n=1 Tax=Embleya sp. AB8 TaxID=3156304 RepID=UPI003C726BD4